jgi:hypothetical protein
MSEPKFEFDVYHASVDGVPVVHIKTPDTWDTEDGPRCRVYLNDGDPIWANPDIPEGELQDGEYPTELALDIIINWPWEGGFTRLMNFIKPLWKYGFEDPVEDIVNFNYRLATGGWSGNEDIIHALKGNVMFWMTCWKASYRGGAYEFEVMKDKLV